MKGIFIIINGLGDLSSRQLGDTTPLCSACTPNLDFLATRGQMGYIKPRVLSSVENLGHFFGNELDSNSKAHLESNGAGLGLKKGDLALNVSFATVDVSGEIVDKHAGRNLTTDEVNTLIEDLNDKIELDCDFILEHSFQNNGVLIFRDEGLEEVSANNKPNIKNKFISEDKVIKCKPADGKKESNLSSDLVNDFIKKAHRILQYHPINIKRRKKGLFSANYILVNGSGLNASRLKQYKKWTGVCSSPMARGFARNSGMNVETFNYPKLKSFDAYSNLHKGLKKVCKTAIKAIKKNRGDSDYVFVYIKETDVAGHDNKPIEKKLMLEQTDKSLFKFLRKFCPPRGVKLVVTGDVCTPCRSKKHNFDPVPVLFYDNSNLSEKKFSEAEARRGVLGRIEGKELLSKTLFLK